MVDLTSFKLAISQDLNFYYVLSYFYGGPQRTRYLQFLYRAIILNLSRDNFQFNKIQPSFYPEYCIQDGNLFPRFSLLLLTLFLPVFTTRALLPIFLEEPWVLTVNPDTSGRANSISKWIRVDVETFESGNRQLRIHTIPGYVGGGGGGRGEWGLGPE